MSSSLWRAVFLALCLTQAPVRRARQVLEMRKFIAPRTLPFGFSIASDNKLERLIVDSDMEPV